MKYILPLLLCLSASAADWNAYYFGSANSITNANSGLAQLPVYVQGKSYLLRGVTTTNDPTLIGDLRYATITLTAHTVTTGSPSYAWLGCTTYNLPPNPLNVRLFLASDAGTYSVSWGMQHHTNYWWSQAYCLWSNQSLTITATVDPSKWSDADGHMGNYSPEVEAGFWTAMANVAQAGVFPSGGHFYDSGGAVKSGTGSACLQLDSISVNQCTTRMSTWTLAQ